MSPEEVANAYFKKLDNLKTDYIEVKVSGLVTEEHKSAKLIFCLYANDGGIKYLDNEKTVTELYGFSYNEILNRAY